MSTDSGGHPALETEVTGNRSWDTLSHDHLGGTEWPDL